jgi:hypothetical protein
MATATARLFPRHAAGMRKMRKTMKNGMDERRVTTLRPTLLGTVVFVFAACAIGVAIEFMVLLGLSFADVIGG